jgi:methyl coenzyme M reductase gamma subunit
MKDRRAAIDMDAMMKRSLNDISAADFIRVLGHRDLSKLAPIVADKKKLELWIDEGPVFEVPIEELLDKIRGEKKKLELEVPDFYGPVVNPAGLRQLDYGQLVQDVAALVEKRMAR